MRTSICTEVPIFLTEMPEEIWTQEGISIAVNANGLKAVSFALRLRSWNRYIFLCLQEVIYWQDLNMTSICSLSEKYFDMNKKQCKDGLDLYKKFLIRMEQVSEFLKVAEVGPVLCFYLTFKRLVWFLYLCKLNYCLLCGEEEVYGSEELELFVYSCSHEI